MSRFTQFLKEQLEDSNNATLGNVINKSPVLRNVPMMSDEKEENKLSEFIKKNDIQISIDVVETIIALVDKSLDDWNREKKIDGEEITKIVKLAIEDNIISVKSY